MYTILEKTVEGLSPLTDTEIIEEVKEQFKRGITYTYIKVLNTEYVLTQDDYIKDLEISELRFVPDSGIFGECVAKKVEVNLNNEDLQFSMQDKEFELYIGVKIENTEYYIKYGTYIVQHPENETTNDNTHFTALDYMIKFNQRYVDEIEYPCTLRQLATSLCNAIGITLSNDTFRNENFIVENNQFVNGETYRQVLQGIAQSAFSWARIDENNVLHFDLGIKNEITETIDYDNYFNLDTVDKAYGPINRIIIREGEIEGENVTIEDAESILQNGLTELVISDNPFAYTQAKRTLLIEAARDLFGFTYMPINEVSLIGFAYLNCTDKIRLKTLQEDYLDTYIFNHTITYNGTTLDKIETPALTETETKYQYKPEISDAVKRTEIIVDKQNQTIEAVVEEVGQYDSRITQVEQDVDGIRQLVENAVDYKRTVEGVTQIHLTEAMEEDALSVEVRGNITYRSDLYPRTDLYPSSDLYINMEGEELR